MVPGNAQEKSEQQGSRLVLDLNTIAKGWNQKADATLLNMTHSLRVSYPYRIRLNRNKVRKK